MRTIILILGLVVSINLYAQKTYIIGALPFNAPLTTQGNAKGDFFGFEISMMNEICKRINAKCIYTPKTIRGLFKSVLDKNIDLALGGLTITKERQKKYLFSLPYMISSGNFIVIKNRFNHLRALRQKTIGTMDGSIYTGLVPQHLGSQVKEQTYIYLPDLLSGLVKGEVDAALIEKQTAVYWTTQGKNISIIGSPIQTGSGFGIMTNQANQHLIQEINRAILSMEKDGTYEKIYQNYFE